jgi:hypothetical protein
VIAQARRDERILAHFVDERPLRCAPLQARDAQLSINAFQQMTRRVRPRLSQRGPLCECCSIAVVCSFS